MNIYIPADVPATKESEFTKNYSNVTKNTGRLFLFAGDQKIEHLNQNFYGPNIPLEANNPEHLFKIAASGYPGCFATQLGLIARYGKQYSNINYIVKLNSKTHLTPAPQKDPVAKLMWSVEQIIKFKQESGLNISGVGYTIYLGSEHETGMLKEAAQVVYTAHQHGLVAILWVYPRGGSITNDQAPELIAGAAGLANALGADFAKIKTPKTQLVAKALQIAAQAAGNTKIICSGGKRIDPKKFIRTIHDEITLGNTAGIAVGRNLYQYSLPDALLLAEAIAKVVYET
jgi:DhnA family fructose-bisphosphate aldolase class Ia